MLEIVFFFVRIYVSLEYTTFVLSLIVNDLPRTRSHCFPRSVARGLWVYGVLIINPLSSEVGFFV